MSELTVGRVEFGSHTAHIPGVSPDKSHLDFRGLLQPNRVQVLERLIAEFGDTLTLAEVLHRLQLQETGDVSDAQLSLF